MVVAPALGPDIIHHTCDLADTVAVQRFGTTRMATVVEPITLLWFLAIGFFGLVHVFDDLSILAPVHRGFDYVVRDADRSGPLFIARR